MNVMCEYASVHEPCARQSGLCSVGQFISILPSTWGDPLFSPAAIGAGFLLGQS